MSKKTLKTPEQSIDASELVALKQFIPNTPEERLPKLAQKIFKELMSQSDLENALIDIHIHTFTNANIPKNFMKFRNWVPPGILKAFISLKSGDFAKANSMKTQKEILDELFRIYTTEIPQITHLFTGLLMMDMQRAIGGGVKQDFHDQILNIQQLFNQQYKSSTHNMQYRNHVLPFLALDPHNPDMFKHFLSAFTPIADRDSILFQDYNAIFQGVKLYPALGYLPYHPDLMKIFDICAEKQIPITTHCGGIRTHPSKDKIEVKYLNAQYQEKTQTFDLKSDRPGGKKFAAYFIRPEHWDRVLLKYPNLKVNIAHLGSNDEWLVYRKGGKNAAKGTVQRTLNLIENNKNVYADFSYSFYKKVNIDAIFKLMQEKAFLQEKIMYGSDYYMCQVEKGDIADYYRNLKNKFASEKGLSDNFFVKNAIRFLS